MRIYKGLRFISSLKNRQGKVLNYKVLGNPIWPTTFICWFIGFDWYFHHHASNFKYKCRTQILHHSLHNFYWNITEYGDHKEMMNFIQHHIHAPKCYVYSVRRLSVRYQKYLLLFKFNIRFQTVRTRKR